MVALADMLTWFRSWLLPLQEWPLLGEPASLQAPQGEQQQPPSLELPQQRWQHEHSS